MRRFPLILFVAALLALALTASTLVAGCGDEGSTTTAGTGTSNEPPVETVEAAAEPPADAPPIEEQESPYGPGSTYSQAVGTLVDGFQLKDIRYADHGTYYRVVFYMATGDGKPALQVPHAETSVSEDGLSIRVVLSGIRSIGSTDSVKAENIDIGDTVVTSLNRLKEGDDQALVYNIKLSKPANYALAGIGDPGRVVVDVMK